MVDAKWKTAYLELWLTVLIKNYYKDGEAVKAKEGELKLWLMILERC